MMSKKFEDYEKGGGVAVIDDQLVEYDDFVTLEMWLSTMSTQSMA